MYFANNSVLMKSQLNFSYRNDFTKPANRIQIRSKFLIINVFEKRPLGCKRSRMVTYDS